MRQKLGEARLAHAVVKEHALGHAVVARFVMFQAEVGDVIAQRQQELVRLVMPSAE